MASEEPEPRQADAEEPQQDTKRQRTASPVVTSPAAPMNYEQDQAQPQQQVAVGAVRPSSSLSTGATSYVDSYFLDSAAHSPSPHLNNNTQQHNYSTEQQQPPQPQQQPFLPTPALPPQAPPSDAAASAPQGEAVVQQGSSSSSSDFVTSAARGLSLLSQFGRPSEGPGPAAATATATANGPPPPPLLHPVPDYLPTSVYPAAKAVVHDAPPPPLPTPQLPPTTTWPITANTTHTTDASGGAPPTSTASFAPTAAASSSSSSSAPVAVAVPGRGSPKAAVSCVPVPPLAPPPLTSAPTPPVAPPAPAPPTVPPPPSSSAPTVPGAGPGAGSNREGRCIVRGSNCTGSTNFILEGLNPDTGRSYTRNDGGACRECAKVDVRFAGTDGAKDPGKCRSARRDWCQYVAPHSQVRCREEACFVDERTGCYTRCSTHSKEDGVRLANLRRAEHFGCMGREVAVVDETQVLDNPNPQVGDVLRVTLQLANQTQPKTLWAKVERLQKPSLVVHTLCESQASFRELKPPGVGGHEWWCKRHSKDHPEAVPMRGKRGRDWDEAYAEFVKLHGPTAYVDNSAPRRMKKDGAFRVDVAPGVNHV